MDLVFTFSKLIFFASFVALGCLNILAAAWPFCFFINSIVSFDNLFSKSKDFKNCIWFGASKTDCVLVDSPVKYSWMSLIVSFSPLSNLLICL